MLQGCCILNKSAPETCISGHQQRRPEVRFLLCIFHHHLWRRRLPELLVQRSHLRAAERDPSGGRLIGSHSQQPECEFHVHLQRDDTERSSSSGGIRVHAVQLRELRAIYRLHTICRRQHAELHRFVTRQQLFSDLR